MVDTTDINPIIMASCLAWAKRWDKGAEDNFPDELREDIEQQIRLKARYARRPKPASLPPAVAMTSGSTKGAEPGYVKFELGSRCAQVPFHLVDVLPPDETLEQFFDLADHVRLSSQSQICLSGSTVFLGRIASAGDVDFCEYVRTSPKSQIIRKSADQKCSSVTPTLFVSGSFNRDDQTRFDRATVRMDPSVLDKLSKANSIKLDYLCRVGPVEGPLSNISLFVDPAAPDVGAAGSSWAFQEVVLGADRPIYPLMRPEQLGRYMLWLAKKIDETIVDEPVKAVKRSLSLSRVLGTGYQKLYPLLEDHSFASLQRRAELDKGLKQAEQDGSPDAQKVIDELNKAMLALPPVPIADLLSVNLFECQRLVKEFRAIVDELSTEAESLL
jgi:hypothetical protein